MTVTAWSPNRLALACASATPRFLVLSEMYLPGWTAAVDGAATPIYRTNYLFRGVVVPAGQHTVTFDYRPGSVLVGAAMSGARSSSHSRFSSPVRRQSSTKIV